MNKDPKDKKSNKQSIEQQRAQIDRQHKIITDQAAEIRKQTEDIANIIFGPSEEPEDVVVEEGISSRFTKIKAKL